MNKDSMEFVVYLIHACADRWHMTPKQVIMIFFIHREAVIW